MRGWLATVPAQALNVTLRNDQGSSGVKRACLGKIERISTRTQSVISVLHSFTATQLSRRWWARTVSAVLADGFPATLPARRAKRSSTCRHT
jgi:hypothetical protein